MFRPGDWVEAVAPHGRGRWKVRTGRLYQVADVFPAISSDTACRRCGPGCQGDGIKLITPEIPPAMWWCSNGFRLAYRPKRKLIRQLMRPLQPEPRT